MFKKPDYQRLPTAIESYAKLTTLRADIAMGISDVQAGRVSTVDIASIKAEGRAMLKIQVKIERDFGA